MPTRLQIDVATLTLSPVNNFIFTFNDWSFFIASIEDFLGASKNAKYPIKIKLFSLSKSIDVVSIKGL